jgi:glycerophosphoryl diester phosphodiesterase
VGLAGRARPENLAPMAQDSARRPARIGHRGAPREYPENTLPSFARALELGADGIELDVHATRDGVVVVHHDPVPMATTPDGRLAGRPIADLTHEQLRTFSVAPGVKIPTLADVLALVGAGAFVYVELKGSGIERLVIDVIRGGGARCAIHSFDHAAVARVRTVAPEIRRGLLFSRRPPDAAASLEAAGALDAWPEWPLVDDAFVASVRRVGGSVIAWTVNDAAAARHLASMGVDGLCTDDVRLIPVAPA